jgi:hypothetical protein
MNEGIRLFANTHQQASHNVSFPGQLRWISNMLPIASAVSQIWIGKLNSLGGRTQDFKQFRTGMPPTLLDNLNLYSFSWNSSGDEQNASLVSAYGVTPVGKVCKFYINAHVHLGGTLRHPRR